MKIFNRIIGIYSEIKLARESRKNWEEKMNEPIVAFPLDSETRKKLIAKGAIKAATYEFRFMFDYCAESCLWTCNDAAIEKYGLGPVPFDELNLSSALRTELIALCDRHDDSLDWDNPMNGIIWSSEEEYAFKEQARTLCWKVIHELGPDYGIGFERNLLI